MVPGARQVVGPSPPTRMGPLDHICLSALWRERKKRYPTGCGKITEERNIIETAISLTSETVQEIESIEFDVILNGG